MKPDCGSMPDDSAAFAGNEAEVSDFFPLKEGLVPKVRYFRTHTAQRMNPSFPDLNVAAALKLRSTCSTGTGISNLRSSSIPYVHAGRAKERERGRETEGEREREGGRDREGARARERERERDGGKKESRQQQRAAAADRGCIEAE